MKKVVVSKKNSDEKITFSKNVFEDRNEETNQNVSIDSQNTSPNSEELSQNQSSFLKSIPLQHVQPFFSSPRSSQEDLSSDNNSHFHNVSSTQNSQFSSKSNYYRSTQQRLYEMSLYDHMGMTELRASLQQIEARINNIPRLPTVPEIYSFQRNQSSRKNKPTHVVKAFNESNFFFPTYSDSQKHKKGETQNAVATRLEDGSVEIICSTARPVMVELSQDKNRVSFIYPNADPTVAPEIQTYEIPKKYALQNVNPEPVNSIPFENCHQQPTSTPFKIHRSPINQTNTVDKLEACCPNTKKDLSFIKNSITALRSNNTGVSCFVPDDKENSRSCKTRLFHTDASKNSSANEDLQATHSGKNPVPSVEEPSSFAIPYCDEVNPREIVSHKSSPVCKIASIKADSSKDINDLSQDIPSEFETMHSNGDLNKSVEVKVNSNDAKKILDKKNINSAFDTPLNQRDLTETDSLETSQLLSNELEPVLSSKSAGTDDLIPCARSHLFKEPSSFNMDSSKNEYEIRKTVKDSKYLDTILVKADSDIVEKSKEKGIDTDVLCTFGTSLNQECNLSSNKPVFKTLLKKENYESKNDNGDKLLQDYPNANKLEIELKPKDGTNKHERSFAEKSVEPFPKEASITQEHKTLILKSQLGEIKQQNMNNHKKSNDLEETSLKKGDTSSTLVEANESEAISNNLLTPTKSQDFEMIDFTQIDDDNSFLTSSVPLNKEFEMAFCVPSSFTKESPISSLNVVKMSPHPNSQPEIIAYEDTNVSTVVEIEVKTSPKSRKLNKTSLKTIPLENSFETSMKRNRAPSTFDCCVIDDNSRCSEVNSDDTLLLDLTEEYPESELMASDSEDVSTSPKKIATQLTRKRRRRKSRLTVTKRRKSSAAKEFFNSSDPKSIFEDLDRLKPTRRNFKKNVDNLVAALINPEHLLDVNKLIFHLVEYLSCILKNPTINPDGLSFAFRDATLNLLPTEDCIVSALFKIEETNNFDFPCLVDSTVTTLYNMLFGKKFQFPIIGLVSLCRVLTEICKRQKNKVKLLQLCGELIKLNHHYAPYLIASVASIWKEIFQTSSYSDKEENMFFRAIARGVKNKPENLLDSEWQQCQAFFSEVLPVKATENRQIPREVRAIIERIRNKRLDADYDKYFLLTTPLVIYTQVRGWKWAEEFFIKPFIVLSLKEYSDEMRNEESFEFMANLYAEIYVHCPDEEDPYGLLKLYYEEGTNDWVHFTAAVAFTKLLLWKGDGLLPVSDFVNNWSHHEKMLAINALFHRNWMKLRYLSVLDIIIDQ